MQFPQLSQNSKYTAKIDNFNGGLNKSAIETNINDNQVSELNNLWFKDGVLQTRPALCYLSDIVDKNENSYSEIADKKYFADDVFYLDSKDEVLHTVSIDGGRFAFNNKIYNYKYKDNLSKNLAGVLISEDFKNFMEPELRYHLTFDLWSYGIDGKGDRFIDSIVLFTDGIITGANGSKATKLCGFFHVKGDAYNRDGNYYICDEFENVKTTHTENFYHDWDKLVFGIYNLDGVDGNYANGETPNYYVSGYLPYIPTIFINKKPNGSGGDRLEDYNLLTDSWIEEFTPNDTDSDFVLSRAADWMGLLSVEYTYLNASNIIQTAEFKISPGNQSSNLVKIGDNNVYVLRQFDSGSTSDYSPSHHFAFLYNDPTTHSFVPKQIPNTLNTVKVTVTNERDTDSKDERANYLTKMSLFKWFGGKKSGLVGGTRLFLSGNPDDVNIVRWSDVNNSLYFPENNFAYVGTADHPITALEAQDSYLVVFKDNSIYAMDYMNSEKNSSGLYLAEFPITPISPVIGCDCPQTIQLINNRLVWLHSDGHVYMLFSENQYSEKNIREISQNIRTELVKYPKDSLKKAISCDYNGNYILGIPTDSGMDCFIWNYDKTVYSYYGSDSKSQDRLAWYKWGLPFTIDKFFQNEHDLFIVKTGCSFTSLVDNSYLSTYRFDTQSDSDSYIQNEKYTQIYNGTEVLGTSENRKDYISQAKILSMLQSKFYDFSIPEAYKNITELYITVQQSADAAISVSYISDDGEIEDSATIRYSGKTAPISLIPLKPSIKMTRIFGFKLSCNGQIKFGGARIKYTKIGEIK